MDSLNYILTKYQLNSEVKSPIEIPNTNRDSLAKLFPELGYSLGVEIGVEQGVYSEILCKANPTVKLFCVDAWTAYKGYRDHVNQAKLDGFYEITKNRLANYNATLIKAFSTEAVKQFADNSLDFVYIDGNHSYGNCAIDLEMWSRKVRSGGIVSGHDYIRRKDAYYNGVVEAVNGFTRAYNINPWFILGRKDKLEGELRDESRSFFWVKP